MKHRITAMIVPVLAACLLSGCCLSHKWQSATCESPEICSNCAKTQGQALGHDWAEATCAQPKTCASCLKTEGEALPHTIRDGGCEEDSVCTECHAVVQAAPGHNMAEETDTTPRMCTNCDYMEPMEYRSGTVYIGNGLERSDGRANFYVRSDAKEFYVKLKNENGEDVYAFITGSFTPKSVPEGKYYVYFARVYYNHWYGPEYLSGDLTEYFTSGNLIDLTGNRSVEYDFRSIFSGGAAGNSFDPVAVDPGQF